MNENFVTRLFSTTASVTSSTLSREQGTILKTPPGIPASSATYISEKSFPSYFCQFAGGYFSLTSMCLHRQSIVLCNACITICFIMATSHIFCSHATLQVFHLMCTRTHLASSSSKRTTLDAILFYSDNVLISLATLHPPSGVDCRQSDDV